MMSNVMSVPPGWKCLGPCIGGRKSCQHELRVLQAINRHANTMTERTSAVTTSSLENFIQRSGSPNMFLAAGVEASRNSGSGSLS